MSEITEAAALLRSQRPDPVNGDDLDARERARGILAEAWLAEHPADDDAAIDASWLVSVGAQNCDECIWKFTGRFGLEVFIWTEYSGPTVNFGDVDIRTPLKSRCQFRLLCAALGIPLDTKG